MRITKLLILLSALTIARGAHAESLALTTQPVKLKHDGTVKVINGSILVGTGLALVLSGAVLGGMDLGQPCRADPCGLGAMGGGAAAVAGAGALAVGLPLVFSGSSDLKKARVRVQAAPYASATGGGGTLRLSF
jgi:hypothetical protein